MTELKEKTKYEAWMSKKGRLPMSVMCYKWIAS